MNPERLVLASLLLSNATWDDIADEVTEDDFGSEACRQVFAVARSLIEHGEPADPMTVAEAGGGAFPDLIALVKESVSPANAAAYARLVRKGAQRRRLAEIGASLHEVDDPQEAIAEADAALMALVDRRGEGPVRASGRSVVSRYEQAEAGETRGLMTGLQDIDRATQGMNPGDLIVLAGRPAMGKSALAVTIASKVGVPVMFFSLEMPREQVEDRLVAGIGGIPLNEIRQGTLAEENFPRFSAAVSRLDQMPITIDETPALSLTEIRARSRRELRRSGVGLVIVDYLQLCTGSGENRTQEIGSISRGLKRLAKELRVPVMALSQLNRSVETRANKRPVLSDLRESGDIEQDADQVWFIYRDEVYHKDSKDRGTAELHIAKHRHYETGAVRLTSQLHWARFVGYDGPFRPFAPAKAQNNVVGFE